MTFPDTRIFSLCLAAISSLQSTKLFIMILSHHRPPCLNIFSSCLDSTAARNRSFPRRCPFPAPANSANNQFIGAGKPRPCSFLGTGRLSCRWSSRRRDTRPIPISAMLGSKIILPRHGWRTNPKRRGKLVQIGVHRHWEAATFLKVTSNQKSHGRQGTSPVSFLNLAPEPLQYSSGTSLQSLAPEPLRSLSAVFLTY